MVKMPLLKNVYSTLLTQGIECHRVTYLGKQTFLRKPN